MMKCIEDLNLDIDSDKQDITPIKEDCNSNCSIPFGNEDTCSVCSNDVTFSTKNKDLEVFKDDFKHSISFEDLNLHSKRGTELNVSNTVTLNISNCAVSNPMLPENQTKKPHDTKIESSQHESKPNRTSMVDSLDSIGHQTEDEGYDSILSSGNYEEKPCRLSASEIREYVPIENVNLVCRAVDAQQQTMMPTLPLHSKVEPNSCDDMTFKEQSHDESKLTSPRKKSLLSQTLSDHEMNKNSSPTVESKKDNPPKLTTSQIRANFLKGGSNSLFNEYFDNDSIQIKTIDEIDVKDRVVQHPLACAHSRSSNSIPDANRREDLYGSQNELELIHATRLNSIGNGVRPRISSFSRQLSSDKSHKPSRPSTLVAPGRCR